MIEMHRTYKYFTGKNWQNLPLERIIDKNPSMSYLSLSGGKCTLIRLRKKSVFLVFRYFFVHFCLRIWLTSQYSHLSVKTQSLFFLFNDMDSKITWIDKLCVCKVLFFFIWLAIYRNIFLLFLSSGMSLKYCNYGFFKICYLLFFVAFVNSRAPTFEIVRGIF